MGKHAIQKEFNTVVLLDMIRSGRQPEELKGSVFFKQELGIVDLTSSFRRLAKSGLCQEHEGDVFALTGDGSAYLDQRQDQVRFFYFASPFITISEYRAAKQAAGEDAAFEDVMLSISAEKVRKFMEARAYREAQCVIFDSGCLHEMAGRTREAFVRYAAALFMAARGLEYVQAIEKLRDGKTDRATVIKMFNGVGIPPKIREGLIRLKDEYSPGTVDEAMEMAAVPGYLSTDDELRQLISDILDGTYVFMDRQIILAHNFTKQVNAYAAQK